MSGISGILVPMDALPGWPEAPTPSILEFLGAFVGIPLLALLVLGAFVYGPTMVRRARGETRGGEALWLGSTASSKALATDAATVAIGGGGRPASRESAEVHVAGAAYPPSVVEVLEQAVQDAGERTGQAVSLFVGAPASPPRELAENLLRAQAEPERSVVIVVDPQSCAVEIATGEDAAAAVTDEQCAQTAGELQAAVESDDPGSGIATALEGFGKPVEQRPALQS